MADKKISQLTGATTPLSGTEVVPVVQSGSTVKVPVSDLTAGRAVGAASLTIDGAAVINESGGNNDFRVEGDTDTNLLFVDASTDRIGVGTATPDVKFHVNGAVQTTDLRAASASTLFLTADSMTVRTTGAAVRLAIDANGSTTVGVASLATTAVDGFLYVPTCAGTPTGTPTAKSGYAPLVVNTTNNKLYFYSGGSWRDAGP